MKKIRLLISLLICGVLLTGCNKTVENPEVIDDCIIPEDCNELIDEEIVLWNIYQTTYITWKNILYFDNSRWIALKLWEEFDWWLIREIDTDEGWIPHSEIIFLIKGEENEENRTWINWYREMFTITAVSKENLENFWASLDDFDFGAFIWENNEYYFVESHLNTKNYTNLQIFDIKDNLYKYLTAFWTEPFWDIEISWWIAKLSSPMFDTEYEEAVTITKEWENYYFSWEELEGEFILKDCIDWWKWDMHYYTVWVAKFREYYHEWCWDDEQWIKMSDEDVPADYYQYQEE